jgi:quercetin dioxygenase-like cupin family protein
VQCRCAKCGFVVLLMAAMATQLVAAEEAEKSSYVAGASSKFMNFPGVPQCMVGAVQKGDPAKGNAVLLLKAHTGCMVPWHWHTPGESLMLVSGRAQAEVKHGSPVTLRAGDFRYLASKHTPLFTCEVACKMFDVAGDAPFDIHYVDLSGSEVPPDQALPAKPKTSVKKPQ